MPFRAPSICGHCGAAHPAKERCERLKKLDADRKARFDRTRPTARARGYDAQWEREARSFLSQPENEFCSCGSPATLVRHILSIRKAPHLRLNKANWLPGCQRCNQIDAARERAKEK